MSTSTISYKWIVTRKPAAENILPAVQHVMPRGPAPDLQSPNEKTQTLAMNLPNEY
jgi:hypothetical protein